MDKFFCLIFKMDKLGEMEGEGEEGDGRYLMYIVILSLVVFWCSL